MDKVTSLSNSIIWNSYGSLNRCPLVKGKESQWFLLMYCDKHISIKSWIKKATEYRNNWWNDILNRKPQEIVTIQGPRHCLRDSYWFGGHCQQTMTLFQGDKHRGIAEVFVTLKPSHSIPIKIENEVLIPILSWYLVKFENFKNKGSSPMYHQWRDPQSGMVLNCKII